MNPKTLKSGKRNTVIAESAALRGQNSDEINNTIPNNFDVLQAGKVAKRKRAISRAVYGQCRDVEQRKARSSISFPRSCIRSSRSKSAAERFPLYFQALRCRWPNFVDVTCTFEYWSRWKWPKNVERRWHFIKNFDIGNGWISSSNEFESQCWRNDDEGQSVCDIPQSMARRSQTEKKRLTYCLIEIPPRKWIVQIKVLQSRKPSEYFEKCDEGKSIGDSVQLQIGYVMQGVVEASTKDRHNL